MTHGADFSTYEPVKVGVSGQPLCIVIKYKDSSTRGSCKHHLIRLERLGKDGKDKITKERVLRLLQRHHWDYFEGKVEPKLLQEVLDKVILKARQSNQPKETKERSVDSKRASDSDRYDFKRKPEAGAGSVKNPSGELDKPKEKINNSPAVLPGSRRHSVKKEASIQEEDFEEDFLNSEDLGLESHKYAEVKKSPKGGNNGKPSFENVSAMKLSDSRISNEPLPSLNKPSWKGNSKGGENMKNGSTEKLRKMNKTLSKSDALQDDFLDGFESGEKRSLTVSNEKGKLGGKTQGKTVAKAPSVKEDEYLDEFEDDFGGVEDRGTVSNKSQKAGAGKKKQEEEDDGFDDLDFEEIPDEGSLGGAKGGFEDFDDIDIGLESVKDKDKEREKTKEKERERSVVVPRELSEIQKLNLNKLTDEEVEAIKKAMDLQFKALKPGDPGYVYEKNESFHGELSNDWDD